MDAAFSINARVFSAHLNCATKAYLYAVGETPPACFFSSTEARIATAYNVRATAHILDGIKQIDFTEVSRDFRERDTLYYVHCDSVVYRCDLPSQACLDRRVTHSMAPQTYIPILYSAREKIDRCDYLLVCFGALAISQVTGTIPETGKVIYGEPPHCKIVRVADHVTSTRKIIDSIRSYGSSRPRLLLNKHCTMCDFQSTCRNACIDRDDLSLISTLSAKERAKYEERGISSVTQLSYGYRPRRQKRINSTASRASPPTKHDHKLKALAIKKAQVHIVGTPSIGISGTPVFLDVEGVPDRGFYYLIGIRYLQNAEHVERSFWADDRDDECNIWRDFLHALQTIDDPIILHYGAYEARFFRHMKQRYSNGVEEDDFINRLVDKSVNLLKVIYGKIYFPTYSNSLKEIARLLGFSWTHLQASGGAS